MSDDISLQHLIHKYVPLPLKPSSKGWYITKCAICNDYKKRSGFKFVGDETVYHCFNCAHAAKYDPHQYSSISENMQKVLDAFNIPEDEYLQISFNALKLKGGGKGAATKIQTDPDTKLVKIAMPDCFIPLEHATDTWSVIANEYLQYDRGLDPKSHPFYIMDDNKYDKTTERKWRGRLIIPYFRNKQLVWYQGRDLRPNSKLRYLNAQTESECILSDYECLYEHTDRPLYVVEGVFDALSIGGVAVFGNTLKAGQIKLLNQSRRRKVYIPDFKGDGHLGALQALKQGWEVSVPDVGSAKDMNAAVRKYGRLYVMKSIQEYTLKGDAALIRINLLCEKSNKNTNIKR